VEIQAAFARRVVDVHGEAGEAWLSALPSLLTACTERWGLRAGAPFALSYNYVVAAALADGAEAVLKAGPPCDELRHEIAALRHFGGRGVVRLLDADADAGVLLLERVRPGTPLMDAVRDDDAMTRAAAGVMRELWRPPDGSHAFPTVADWGKRLDAGDPRSIGPLPAALVRDAAARFRELLASSAAPVVLHGDLHHWNILRAGDERWLAIDPKGVLGEREYEAGALLRNPLPDVAGWPDLRRVLARRVDVLAEALGMDRARLAGWGMAQAVLAALWSWDDHGAGWEAAAAVAVAVG